MIGISKRHEVKINKTREIKVISGIKDDMKSQGVSGSGSRINAGRSERKVHDKVELRTESEILTGDLRLKSVTRGDCYSGSSS